MKHRKLRIAWSVLWGVVLVLLCMLWVRSYFIWDSPFGPIFGNRELQFNTLCGRVFIGVGQPSSGLDYWTERTFVPKKLTADGAVGTNPNSNEPIAWAFAGNYGSLGFGIMQSNKERFVYFPYWSLAMLAAGLAAIALPLRSIRFSLRTLLLATTLIAVVLGLVVYAARK